MDTMDELKKQKSRLKYDTFATTRSNLNMNAFVKNIFKDSPRGLEKVKEIIIPKKSEK